MKKILQVFRKLFKRKPKDELERTIYICDPNRATNCVKTGCWYFREGPCQCTAKKEYAKLNEKGKPIVATPLDIWNDKYWEREIFGSEDSQKKQRL